MKLSPVTLSIFKEHAQSRMPLSEDCLDVGAAMKQCLGVNDDEVARLAACSASVGVQTVDEMLSVLLTGEAKTIRSLPRDLVAAYERVARCAAPCAVSIAQLSCDTMLLSLGSSELDSRLGGGLRIGTVTEIVGASGCGKTQLAMQAAVHAAAAVGPSQNHVIFLAAEPLPSTRFEHFATPLALPRQWAVEDILNSIHIRRVTGDLHQALLQTEAMIRSKENWCRLIVIDSIAAALHDQELAPCSSADAFVAAALLKRIASQYGVAVLVTNQVRGTAVTGLVRPVAHASFGYGVDTSIAVWCDRARRHRYMQVHRSNHMQALSPVEFVIRSDGVFAA